MISITLPHPTQSIYIWQHKQAPETSGIYLIYDRKDAVIYIGQTTNFRSRLTSHYKGTSNTKTFNQHFFKVDLIEVENPMERDIYETYAINTLKPPLNKDKNFLYKESRENYIHDNDCESITGNVFNEQVFERAAKILKCSIEDAAWYLMWAFAEEEDEPIEHWRFAYYQKSEKEEFVKLLQQKGISLSDAKKYILEYMNWAKETDEQDQGLAQYIANLWATQQEPKIA